MKNLSFKLLTVFFIVSLISCTSNDDSINPNATEFDTNIESFLNDYYGKENYSFAKEIDLSNLGKNLSIQKIILKNNHNNIGYIIINSDNSELDYFVNVNISKKKSFYQKFFKWRN